MIAPKRRLTNHALHGREEWVKRIFRDQIAEAAGLAWLAYEQAVDSPVASAAAGTALKVGGQDCHMDVSGAHTGDIAAEMLKEPLPPPPPIDWARMPAESCPWTVLFGSI